MLGRRRRVMKNKKCCRYARSAMQRNARTRQGAAASVSSTASANSRHGVRNWCCTYILMIHIYTTSRARTYTLRTHTPHVRTQPFLARTHHTFIFYIYIGDRRGYGIYLKDKTRYIYMYKRLIMGGSDRRGDRGYRRNASGGGGR